MAGNLQIFISHASRDRVHVGRLERTLSLWGLRPWVDLQGLAGGQRWSAELQRAIVQSAALLLVVTPAALASETVRREYREAQAQRIPVLLLAPRRVDHLPEELAQLPQIEWKWPQWRGEEKLFLALYDLGKHPDEPSAILGSRWPVNLFLSNAGRGAAGWRRFTVNSRTYTALIVGTGLGVALLALFVLAWAALALWLGGGIVPSPNSPTSGMIGSLGILVVFLVEIVCIQLLLIQTTAFASYRLKWWTSEVVLVTDSSISTNLYRFRWARAGVELRHYPFAAIDTLVAIERRQTLFGAIVLTLRRRAGGPTATIWLPRRLTRGHDVVAQIDQAVHAYQDKRRAVPAEVRSGAHPENSAAAQVSEVAASAVFPRAPRYVVLAGVDDLRVLADMQQQLAWRGVYQTECAQLPPPEALVVPTAAGASQAGFALVCVSEAVLRSARLQPIVTDLLARGVLVIPVVLRAHPPLPPLLAQLQWVDFSPRTDPQRSRCDLLNALDAAGVPLTPPATSLDSDLVLARAMHYRPQADWDVFRVHAQMRPVYRFYQVTQMVPLSGSGCLLSLIAVFACLLGTLFVAQLGNGPQGLTQAALLLVIVLMALALAVTRYRSYRRQLAGAVAYSRLTRNAAVPEMVVVTPTGVVVHTVERGRARPAGARTTAFSDYALPFADIRAIERRRGYYAPVRLRCLLWRGETVEFGLPGQLVDVDGAADTIEQRWRDSTQQHGATVPATARGASTRQTTHGTMDHSAGSS